MKHRALFATVVILVLAFPPCTYSAQLNFTPVMTVSEEYNDNIFLTNNNEEDDYITRVSLGGTLELLGRTAGAEITYLPAYEWYNDYTEFDGWTQDLLARTWYNFTANTSIELRDAFIRTRGSLEDAGFVGATSDDPLVQPDIAPDPNQRGLSEYYENAATVRLDHRFGAEDTVYTAFRYSLYRDVDGPRFERSDNDIWEPSIGGTYWFTNFWGIETDLSYTNLDYKYENDQEEWYGRLRLNRRIDRHLNAYVQYEHTILNYDQETIDDIDYVVYEPTVGFNYQLDENTRIDIGVGWYYQDLDHGDNDDGFILTALADKVWPFRRGLVGVTLLSGTDIDNEGVEDLGFNVYYEGAVRGEFAFTPRFSGTATAGYRWDDYPDETPSRTDKTITATAGLQYQALRWMALNLDYIFTDLSSDDDFDEYTNNRVIFSITFTPEQPFRLMQ
ncbi:MAG: outer membrane beta-barrel protein [Deltaproteobacteria bacterium]|nr:outer membrane beta-barrel protein [Deltaproteobacteria bacterium]